MANTDNFFSFLGGVAAGLVLGILVAPERGSKTREIILEKFDDYADEIVQGGASIIDQIQQKLNLNLSELEEQIDSLLDSTNQKREDTIEMLEKKLEKLKSMNKKLSRN